MIKLAHACIESADLDATERFYACLGLRRQFEFRNLSGLLIGYYLRFDDQTFLEVIRVEKVRPEGTVRHFAIESDDIETLRQRLVAAGYAATDKRLGEDGTWLVECVDPSGVAIELHEYDMDSLQQRGGVCVLDYTPRPATP